MNTKLNSEKCCISIYMDYHVSEIKKQPKSIRDAWKLGQELYTRVSLCTCERDKSMTCIVHSNKQRIVIRKLIKEMKTC